MKKFAWSISALNTYETCPKQYFHLRIAKDIKSDMNEANNYGTYVHDSIRKRIDKNTELPLDLTHMEKQVKRFASMPAEKLTEQKMAINREFEPTGWFDDDVYCRAIMDLTLLGDTSAVIVDWKTGKIKDDFDQLKLMACMLFLHRPKIQKIYSTFVWLKSKKATKHIMYRNDMPGFWNEILPRVNKMENAIKITEFDPRPSGLCRGWCPVKKCPHYEERI